MKKVHNVQLQVFSKEHEDEEKILNTLKSLVPFDLDQEKIHIERKKASGFNEKPIIIFTLILEKERHTNLFLKNLNEKLSNEQKELLKRQKYTRLDKEFFFFLRLDKEKLMQNNEFWITDSGNCFHIRLSIAAFPKTVEKAVQVIDELFS